MPRKEFLNIKGMEHAPDGLRITHLLRKRITGISLDHSGGRLVSEDPARYTHFSAIVDVHNLISEQIAGSQAMVGALIGILPVRNMDQLLNDLASLLNPTPKPVLQEEVDSPHPETQQLIAEFAAEDPIRLKEAEEIINHFSLDQNLFDTVKNN